jgi:hypothetical protein
LTPVTQAQERFFRISGFLVGLDMDKWTLKLFANQCQSTQQKYKLIVGMTSAKTPDLIYAGITFAKVLFLLFLLTLIIIGKYKYVVVILIYSCHQQYVEKIFTILFFKISF